MMSGIAVEARGALRQGTASLLPVVSLLAVSGQSLVHDDRVGQGLCRWGQS